MIPTSHKARLVFIDNIKINHIETLTQPSKDLLSKIIHKIQLIENKEVILFVQLNW